MITTPTNDTYNPNRSKTEEHFLKRTREIIKQYNEQASVNIFGETVDNVQTYLMHYKYYYGKQENVDYAFMEQIAPGVNTPAIWKAGQKVTSMVDHMKGNAIDQIKGYKVVAKAVSPDTVKKRSELFQKAELELELRPVFDRMAQASGIRYQPIQGFTPQTKEDIDKFKSSTYKERAAIACATLAKNAMYTNFYREKLPQVFFDAMVAGPGGMKIYAENGHVRWRNILPVYGIIDTSVDSDVNRGARFGGEVRWLTLNQILTEYDLDKEQADRIKDICGGDKWQSFNTTGFQHWKMVGGQMLIRVYDLEWKDLKDLRFETNTDEYGTKHYVATKKKNLSQKDREVKKKDLIKKPIEVVYQSTLIGDCELVNYGERTNQVRSMSNLSETELSYHWYTPGMRLGQMVSVVKRLAGLQDKLDLYDYIEQKALSDAKGKKFSFDVSQLSSGETLQDVMIKLQTMGLIPYDSTATEEMGRPPSGKYIDSIDLTLDEKTINAMEILKASTKAEMEEVVSIPKIAQGMQTAIVGKGVQENTIARSSIGTLSYYDSFLSYVNKVLLYSANVAKILYTREGEYEGTFIVGDSEHEFLKITKDMLFEDFTVYVDVSDKMDEQAKNRIITIALAQAQNGLIDMLDYITIEKCESYAEALNYFEYSLNKKRQEQQKAQAEQMQAAQQIAQTRAEATQASQLMNQVGQNNRATLQTKGAIIQEGMRQEGQRQANEQQSANV